MRREDISQEEFDALKCQGYEAVRLLGEGAFSRVLLVRERKDRTMLLQSMRGENEYPLRKLRGELPWIMQDNGAEPAHIRYLACKICSQSKLGLQEGHLLQQIEHPLFPRFFGMWQEKEKVFLLMEVVFGSSLEAMMERRGSFTERQTACIGLELAAGLKYLHELPEPLLFRDVKPANILIRQDGRVKLLDVGCACRLGEKTGSLAGTPGYGAPEQLGTGHVLTTACDVYGLGRTLQEAVGKNCKKSFGQVLDACTRLQPHLRLKDMREVIAELIPFADAGRGRRMSRRRGDTLPQVICVKNIWESNYKNT